MLVLGLEDFQEQGLLGCGNSVSEGVAGTEEHGPSSVSVAGRSLGSCWQTLGNKVGEGDRSSRTSCPSLGNSSHAYC